MIENPQKEHPIITDENSDNRKRTSSTEVLNLSAIARRYYTQPRYAELKRLLYEQTFPISQSFINLAIIKEEEQKSKDLQIKELKSVVRDERINSFEDIHKPKEAIKLETIFEQQHDDKIPERILIEGRAGIGKTTSCQFVVNQWATEDGKLKGWRDKFKLLIWLPLREYSVVGNMDLLNFLSLFIYNNFFNNTERKQYTERQIRAEVEKIVARKELLLLIDGYDEIVPNLNANKDFRRFFEEELLAYSHWILTSRPFFATNIKANIRLENIGFISEDIPLYVQQFFTDIAATSKAEPLLKLLIENKNIHGVSHIPINLELICSVWDQERESFDATLNMTALYDKLVLNLLKRYLHKYHGRSLTTITWTDVFTNKKHDCKTMLDFLERIAWQGMQQTEIILPARLLGNIAASIWLDDIREDESIAVLKKLGLLKSLGAARSSILDQEHYFIHLTFQEYFAARYVVNHFNDPAIQDFICKYKFNKRYEIVWWFVAGLLELTTASSMSNNDVAMIISTEPRRERSQLITYFNLLSTPPHSLLLVQERCLQWRCWDEAGLPQIAQQDLWIKDLLEFTKQLVTQRHKQVESITLYLSQSPKLIERYSHELTQLFLELLDNEDKYICREALSVLKKLPMSKPQLIERLLMLAQHDDFVREQAAIVLGTIGMKEPVVMASLLALFKVKKINTHGEDIRIRLSEGLGELKIKDPMVIKVWLELLKDDNSIIRTYAVVALGNTGIKTPMIVTSLQPLLRDEVLEVRRNTSSIFKSWGEETNDEFNNEITDLLSLLENEDVIVRRSATVRLANLRITEPAGIEGLVKLLKDTDSSVREAAAKALGELNIKEPNVIENLSLLFKDENKIVRREVANIFGKLEVKNLAVKAGLLALLKEEDSRIQIAAATTLAKLEIEELAATETLLALTKHKDIYVRGSAALSLGYLKKNKLMIAESLLALLKIEDGWYVHWHAITAIDKLEVKEPIVIEELLAALFKDPSHTVRQNTAEVLQKLLSQEEFKTYLVLINEFISASPLDILLEVFNFFSPLFLLPIWVKYTHHKLLLEIIAKKIINKALLGYYSAGYLHIEGLSTPLSLSAEHYQELQNAINIECHKQNIPNLTQITDHSGEHMAEEKNLGASTADATLEKQPRFSNDTQEASKKNSSNLLSEFDRLSQFFIDHYKKPKYAEIELFLYEETFPITENFINLAIIKEEEQIDKEKKIKELREENPDRDASINSFEDTYKPKEPVKIEDLFDNWQGYHSSNHIIIEGPAGVGKTTLCQYIVNQWAETKGKLNAWQEQFKIVIWLELRSLSKYANREYSNLNLAEIIFENYFQYQEDFTLDELSSALKKSGPIGNKILFILDGYDELSPILQDPNYQGFKEFFERKILALPNWILTSRPYYTIKIKADLRLENVGFISEDIPIYVRQFFKNIGADAKAETLLKLLADNKNIHGISHIPINLGLICSIWDQEGENLDTTLNMTELYDKLVLNLLKRYLHKFHARPLTMLTWADVFANKKHDCKSMLNFIEKIAWGGIQHTSIVLSTKLLKNAAANIWFDDIREHASTAALKNLGLLKGLGIVHKSVLGQEHYFIHLTFQEYFAARHIFNNLNDEDIKDFIRKNKYQKRYEIVWFFVAGLIGLNQTDLSKKETFFKLLSEGPQSLFFVHQRYLEWRCWDEAKLPSLVFQETWEKDFLVFIKMARSIFFISNLIVNCLQKSPKLMKKYEEKITESWLELSDYKKVETYNPLSSISPILKFHVLSKLKIADPRIIEEIFYFVKFFKEPYHHVHAASDIAYLLSQFEDTTILKYFLPLLKDKSVRRLVALILGRLEVKNSETEEALFELLQDENLPNGPWRFEELEVLGRLGLKNFKIVERLLALLKNEKPYIRARAAEALGYSRTQKSEIIEELLKLLKDKEWIVREGAAEGLGLLGIKQQNIIENLVELLKDKEQRIPVIDHKKRKVRLAAAKSLTKLYIKNAWIEKDILTILTEEKDEEVYSLIARCLGQLNRENFWVVNDLLKFIKVRNFVSMSYLTAQETLNQLEIKESWIGYELLELFEHEKHQIRASLLHKFIPINELIIFFLEKINYAYKLFDLNILNKFSSSFLVRLWVESVENNRLNKEKEIKLLKVVAQKLILSPLLIYHQENKLYLENSVVLPLKAENYQVFEKAVNEECQKSNFICINLTNLLEGTMQNKLINDNSHENTPMIRVTYPYELLHNLETEVKNIVANPENYGLNPEGLSYSIVKNKHEGIPETTLVAEIKKKPTNSLAPYLNEQDTKFGFSIQHWCAVFNYAELSSSLVARGIGLGMNDNQQLKPTHLAALMGSQAFLGKHFARKPEFSEIKTIFNSGDKKIDVYLNELHIALIGRQIEVVKNIYTIFHEKHISIKPEIKALGNLLHLIVYFSLSEQYRETNNLVSSLNLLKVVLQYYNSAEIKKLLTESENNYESYTPLALAARYGKVGLVQAFITYLRLHIEESNGLKQIEIAFYVAASHGQNDIVEMFIHYYKFKPNSDHIEYESTLDELKIKEKTDARYTMILSLIRHSANQHERYNKASTQEQPYENLVLSGGGGKGFALPYALKALREQCQQRSKKAAHDMQAQALGFENIVRVIGTSAGSIFGLGIALGYTPEEIESKLDYDFSEFLESEHIKKVVAELNLINPDGKRIFDEVLKQLELSIAKLAEVYNKISNSDYPVLRGSWEAVKQPISLYNEVQQAIKRLKELNNAFKGFSSGKVAYDFLTKLLTDKSLPADLSFGELEELVKKDSSKYKHLHVVVTNLSQSNFEVLSSENPLYRNYIILDAVRASMSYPIVFMPHHLRIKENNNIKKLQDEYIDGGILRNCAVDEFDFKIYADTDLTGDPRYPVLNKKTIALGFKVEEKEVRDQTNDPNDFLARIKAFISIYVQAEALVGTYMNRDYHRRIEIDTGEITTFTFKKLTAEEKEFLKMQANIAVGKYFGNLDNIIMPLEDNKDLLNPDYFQTTAGRKLFAIEEVSENADEETIALLHTNKLVSTSNAYRLNNPASGIKEFIPTAQLLLGWLFKYKHDYKNENHYRMFKNPQSNVNSKTLNEKDATNLHRSIAIHLSMQYKLPFMEILNIIEKSEFSGECDQQMTTCKINLSKAAIDEIEDLGYKYRRDSELIARTNPSLPVMLDAGINLGVYVLALLYKWYKNDKQEPNTSPREERILRSTSVLVIKKNLYGDLRSMQESFSELNKMPALTKNPNLENDIKHLKFLLEDFETMIGVLKVEKTSVGDLNDVVYLKRYIQFVLASYLNPECAKSNSKLFEEKCSQSLHC